MSNAARPAWLSLAEALGRLAVADPAPPKGGAAEAAQQMIVRDVACAKLLQAAARGEIVGYHSRKTVSGYLPGQGGAIEREVWRQVQRDEAAIDVQRGVIELPGGTRYYGIEFCSTDIDRLCPVMRPAVGLVWLSVADVLDRIAAAVGCEKPDALGRLIAAAAEGAIVGLYGRTARGHLPHSGDEIVREVWHQVQRGEAAVDVSRSVIETPGAVRSIAFRSTDVERLWPAPNGGSGLSPRSWPTLADAAADLIDWRRWHLSRDQFDMRLKAGDADRSHPLNRAVHPPGMVRLKSPHRRGCSWNGRAYQPDADGSVTVPAEAAGDLAAHGFRIWGIADQTGRELRELITARRVEIRGIGRAGDAIALSADCRAAILRFGSNEIWLSGPPPRLWLTVMEVIECPAAANTCDGVMMPPLIFIEPREAVQLVRAALGCSSDNAVAFQCDWWFAGEITPRFTSGTPPAGVDPRMADWFAGAIVLPGKVLPRRASNGPDDDPEPQYWKVQHFPFLIDRRELEAVLRRAGAAPGPTAVVALEPEAPAPQPPEIQSAPVRHPSPAVQAMRDAYARLVTKGAITTKHIGTARFQKVRGSQEVKAHVARIGNERGLSQDTFAREVLKPDWPGKPQISPANP
jgi:hypothetical protein